MTTGMVACNGKERLIYTVSASTNFLDRLKIAELPNSHARLTTTLTERYKN